MKTFHFITVLSMIQKQTSRKADNNIVVKNKNTITLNIYIRSKQSHSRTSFLSSNESASGRQIHQFVILIQFVSNFVIDLKTKTKSHELRSIPSFTTAEMRCQSTDV